MPADAAYAFRRRFSMLFFDIISRFSRFRHAAFHAFHCRFRRLCHFRDAFAIAAHFRFRQAAFMLPLLFADFAICFRHYCRHYFAIFAIDSFSLPPIFRLPIFLHAAVYAIDTLLFFDSHCDSIIFHFTLSFSFRLSPHFAIFR
jgi:hypothetical protein